MIHFSGALAAGRSRKKIPATPEITSKRELSRTALTAVSRPGIFITEMGNIAARPRILAHVLARNDQEVVKDCLGSLLSQDYQNLLIVVSDNASTDSTPEIIRETAFGIEFIENRENFGYAKGHNQVASRKGFDAFLALNADVVLEPDFVSRLAARAFSDPACGMAAGKLLESGHTSRIDSAGVYIDRFRRNREIGAGRNAYSSFTEPAEVFGAFGAAGLYKKSMIEDLSFQGELFDTDFFAYREEVDLAWRARSRGWKCLFEPDAIGFHVHQYRPQTRATRPVFERRLQRRNRYLMLLKNESPLCFARDLPFIAAFELGAFLHALFLEPAILPAYVDAMKLAPAMLAKRKLIRSFRTVRDTSICEWLGKERLIRS
ncbi:MAG: glycosyltransferase family 2 protein [Deltaproteobacteria bacterium]|nr:glycosyltransferase family 2 protein [Deltaproteobacteria bacterium]